jgi:hypothetical protein
MEDQPLKVILDTATGCALPMLVGTLAVLGWLLL